MKSSQFPPADGYNQQTHREAMSERDDEDTAGEYQQPAADESTEPDDTTRLNPTPPPDPSARPALTIADTRICRFCDGGPGNEGVCLCGRRAYEHDLIKTGDADSCHAIEDGHGEVVLAYCRVCREGESGLAKYCTGPKKP